VYISILGEHKRASAKFREEVFLECMVPKLLNEQPQLFSMSKCSILGNSLVIYKIGKRDILSNAARDM
jgi:hypothetical protein